MATKSAIAWLAVSATIVAAGAMDGKPAAPARAPTAPEPSAPTPRPARFSEVSRDGFAVTQRGGLALFSRRTRDGRYRLVMQRGDRRRRATSVRTASRPFAVDLGTDAGGRPVAVFRQCVRARCRLYRFDPATDRARPIPIRLRPHGDGRAPSVHRGVVTFARSGRAPTDIVAAPLDGSARPVVVDRVDRIVRSIDTSDRGVVYAAAAPSDGLHYSAGEVFFRGHDGQTRLIARGGSGEEFTTDNLTPTFAGRSLVWGVTNTATGNELIAHLARLNLVTGRRGLLNLPGGALFASAADDARPDGGVLVDYDTGGPEGFDPDPARQVVRRVSVRRFHAVAP